MSIEAAWARERQFAVVQRDGELEDGSIGWLVVDRGGVHGD